MCMLRSVSTNNASAHPRFADYSRRVRWPQRRRGLCRRAGVLSFICFTRLSLGPTLIQRAVKGLEDLIGVYVLDPLMLENGWEIPPTNSGQGQAMEGTCSVSAPADGEILRKVPAARAL